MSKQCLLFLASFTILCGCRSVQQSNQYAEISIWTPTGWWLDIKPDGSGKYGFGSSFNQAQFASGTFNFEEIFNKLSATAFEDGNFSEYYSVAFRKKGDISTGGVYTKDKDLVRMIFELAHKKGGIHNLTQTESIRVIVHPNENLNKLWSEKPPFPD
jgi:hypothetical protein